MAKKKFYNDPKNIADAILCDYVLNAEDNSAVSELKNKLPFIIANGMGLQIKGTEDVFTKPLCMVKLAAKFLCKYNPTYEKNFRKLLPYEYGGEEYRMNTQNPKLIELNSYALGAGTYLAKYKESNYIYLEVVNSAGDDSSDPYMFEYTLVFIGKKCTKMKDKFYEMYDEYSALVKDERTERVMYSNGSPASMVIFKPFDAMVFKGKDKYIKYIDNWVDKIPLYSETYRIVPKLSILIYGEPGTGKSTFCKAVAKHLNISTVSCITADYFSNMGESDSHYGGKRPTNKAFGGECVQSIDDIDCVCKSREVDDSKENTVAMSNLLSFLDNPPTFMYKAKNGVRYPVSIVIATTNYYDRLDEAVKRAGRFDLKINMSYFDKSEAQEMCDLYGLKLEDLVGKIESDDWRMSPSELQALCIENVDSELKKVK